MCQSSRVYSSGIYFAALLFTLYASMVVRCSRFGTAIAESYFLLQLQMPLLALLSVVVQILAAFWYGLSCT